MKQLGCSVTAGFSEAGLPLVRRPAWRSARGGARHRLIDSYYKAYPRLGPVEPGDRRGLVVTPDTVKRHLRHVLSNLGVTNRTQPNGRTERVGPAGLIDARL